MTFTSLRLKQQSAVCALYKVKDDLSENLHEYPSSNWLTTSNKAKGQVMLLITLYHKAPVFAFFQAKRAREHIL